MGSVLQIMIMSDDNISPVQFNWSVVSNSLQPHGLQYTVFPVHQTHVHGAGDAIQPSHLLLSPSPPAFNLSLQSSGSFPVSQIFASGGQSIGVSASASVLPMNIQD